MQIVLEGAERLRFPDGSPVRAASALARLGDGFVVVQDDASHAAWFREGSATRVRVLPPVDGLDLFDDASRTKHLKPDLEAGCEVTVDGTPAVLLLGSGSSPARMRVAIIRLEQQRPQVEVADLTPLYGAVARALAIEPDVLNLEGACVVGNTLRWFHRGLPAAGLPSASVDLDLGSLLSAARGRTVPASVAVSNPRTYDLGKVRHVGLAVTDAITWADGTVLASAVAEDSPNPRDDGPVVASALVLLEEGEVGHMAPLPSVDGEVSKVEGLMMVDSGHAQARVLAVVDQDDPQAASLCLRLLVHR